MLIDVLLIVRNDALSDCLANSVDLRCVTTAGDAHADVDLGELVESDDQERFVDFEA